MELTDGNSAETCPNGDEAWMRGKPGDFIIVSFKSRIRQLRDGAKAARKAYTGDYSAPCQYFADVCDEAAFLFEKRLQRITDAQAVKTGTIRKLCGMPCEQHEDCDRPCIRPEGHVGRHECKNHAPYEPDVEGTEPRSRKAIEHLNAAAELLWQMHSDHPHAGAIADRVTLAVAQLERIVERP